MVRVALTRAECDDAIAGSTLAFAVTARGHTYLVHLLRNDVPLTLPVEPHLLVYGIYRWIDARTKR